MGKCPTAKNPLTRGQMYDFEAWKNFEEVGLFQYKIFNTVYVFSKIVWCNHLYEVLEIDFKIYIFFVQVMD